jgi:hypothetical protein
MVLLFTRLYCAMAGITGLGLVRTPSFSKERMESHRTPIIDTRYLDLVLTGGKDRNRCQIASKVSSSNQCFY